MKLVNLRKRTVAFMLCLAMLLSIVPSSAVAADATTEEAVSTEGTEVISLREENVKHFDMGNGIYQAIAYSHPIHEMDSEGNWQDIDFGMSLTQTKGVRAYTNDAGTAFQESYVANQPIMTLSGADTSIAMTLVTNTNTQTMSTQAMQSTTPITATFTASQTDIQTFESAQSATFSNTLLYENVISGVDLEYIVDPWTVKENIIVKQPATQYAYNFKLDLEGLYPVLQTDGSVLIYNAEIDETEYEIPAPYMYDAAGEMSFDVTYTLSGENGVYYFTVTADTNWVNAPERVFPVTIDPSFNITNSVMQDTYINSDSPGEVKGSNTFFYAGDTEVGYVKVPTPAIPTDATLNWASLDVHYFYWNNIKSGHVDVTAHRVTGFDWDESWLTGDWVAEYGGSNSGLHPSVLGTSDSSGVVRFSAGGNAYPATPQPASFLITEAVQAWRTGSPNYGIGLKYKDDTSTNLSVAFRSTEGPVEYRPSVVFSYNASTAPRQYSYIHYHDSSMVATEDHYPDDKTIYIEDAVQATDLVYSLMFGIHFSSGNTSTLDTSIYDPEANCIDISEISTELCNRRISSNEIVIFWTDHPAGFFCNHRDQSQCHQVDALGGVYNFHPAIQTFRIPVLAAEERKAAMSILLMHETAHTFAFDDVYDDGLTEDSHDTLGGWVCVMEKYDIEGSVTFYQDIIKGRKSAFCAECTGELENAIAKDLWINR